MILNNLINTELYYIIFKSITPYCITLYYIILDCMVSGIISYHIISYYTMLIIL